jgi:hypothetical protein
MDSCGVCTIWGRAVYSLSIRFGLLGPLSSYRVYDVEDAKFVSPWRFLKVCVQFLDEDRFRLGEESVSLDRGK